MKQELYLLQIEDNEDDALLVQRMLKKEGYTLVSRLVETKSALVAALDECRWDIILSDYAMPLLNGMEALKTVLNHENDSPFIIVSGEIGEERAVALLKTGADDYIRKDNLVRLGQAVKRALKQREIRLEKIAAEKAMIESEKRYRLVFEKSPLGIVQFDEKGDIIDCNENFATIIGIPKDQLVGLNMLKMMPEGPALDAAKGFLEKGTGQFEGKFRTINANEDIYIRAVLGAITDNKGIVPGAVGIFEDISEKVRLENHLKRTQQMESIGNLAGGIAHDFNNLLFPIIGLSSMLLDDLPEGSAEHKTIAQILKAGERGRELVKQILAFSRKSDLKKETVQFQIIITEALKLSRSTIPSNIVITDKIQKDCGLINANPSQLNQIVMNLITNAWHALEYSSGTIDVQLHEVDVKRGLTPESIPPGRYARLSVSDTGKGIDPSILDKIFEPYFTTKEKDKGTGLGLSMVYGIVKDHLGDIQVHSELGKGTCFSVYLPLRQKKSKKKQSDNIKTESIVTGHERILLIDDEKAIVHMVKQMLEKLGYRVTEMTSSLEALEAFKTTPHAFDLIITDMTMPNLTGDQLAKELIAIRPDIPVIISTGFSERLNETQAEQLGIKAFMMKPIARSEMIRTIRTVLDADKV
jgi:PAS domain S-box-containing protein